MPDFDGFYKTIYDYIKSEGIKLNHKKESVIEVLNVVGKPLNVSEIQTILQETYEPKISINFLYSYLKQLDQIGVVGCELQSGVRKYFLKPFKKNVAICCVNCANKVVLYDEILENACWKLCLNSGFSDQEFELIIYGICKTCKI